MLVRIKHDIEILLLEYYFSLAKFHLNALLIFQTHFERQSHWPKKTQHTSGIIT